MGDSTGGWPSREKGERGAESATDSWESYLRPAIFDLSRGGRLVTLHPLLGCRVFGTGLSGVGAGNVYSLPGVKDFRTRSSSNRTIPTPCAYQ